MSSQNTQHVAKTIAVTATITMVLTSIFFFLCYKCYISRRRENNKVKGSFRREDVTMAHKGLKCKNSKKTNSFSLGNDMNNFSLRKLEGGQVKAKDFPKFVFNLSYKEDGEEEEDQAEEKRVLNSEGENKSEKLRPHLKSPLLHHDQQSEVMIVCDGISNNNTTNNNNNKPVLHSPTTPKPIQIENTQQKASQLPQASFSLTPLLVPKNPTNFSSNVLQQSHQTSTNCTPISPPSPKQNPLPPPQPPPPPPPPTRPLSIPRAKPSSLPPPMPKASGWISSRRTSFALKGKVANRPNNKAESLREESSNGNNAVGQMKLKPLHWDKVATDADHSTVWDEINDGSLGFNEELMESLFGYSTQNRQSSERTNIFSALTRPSSSPPTQIFLLDPRKSQNTAIVLRSLAISRREILDALTDGGQDLSSETLERLTKISPTQEEISKILKFSGNPSKLADAESFLFHILRAVPSAFTRFDAMLFRVTYGNEVLHLRESLQTLELACRELRSRGLFLKLLEAILKAGNKMNEGTSRGNAQGFNLNALKKLSDIRSNDGKTTLLHFVVEQVARSEGKRKVQKGQEDQCLVSLGLTSLEGLSAKELSNVKKAATIEPESLAALCTCLGAKVTEIRKNLSSCDGGERGWFCREMKGFLEECEAEIEEVREEQKRVMEVVKRTTEYYQAGDTRGNLGDKKPSDTNPFQLFVIVKDFLDVVDQVCVEIGKKLRQKRNGFVAVSSPPLSPPAIAKRSFSSFAAKKTLSSSSESDSDDEF